MPDTGWLTLATFSNDTSFGNQIWGNASYAQTEDGQPTIVTDLTPSVSSYYLKGVGLVSPPADLAGASILGVEMQFKRTNQNGTRRNEDSRIKLVVGGAVTAVDKAVAGVWVNGFSGIYGGSADTWGLPLTGADVVAANFGVVVAAKGFDAYAVAAIDVVQMRITYDLAGVLLCF